MSYQLNLNSLEIKIKEQELSLDELGELTGISSKSLEGLLSGKIEWKASDIILVSDALKLSNLEKSCIFFAESE